MFIPHSTIIKFLKNSSYVQEPCILLNSETYQLRYPYVLAAYTLEWPTCSHTFKVTTVRSAVVHNELNNNSSSRVLQPFVHYAMQIYYLAIQLDLCLHTSNVFGRNPRVSDIRNLVISNYSST